MRSAKFPSDSARFAPSKTKNLNTNFEVGSYDNKTVLLKTELNYFMKNVLNNGNFKWLLN